MHHINSELSSHVYNFSSRPIVAWDIVHHGLFVKMTIPRYTSAQVIAITQRRSGMFSLCPCPLLLSWIWISERSMTLSDSFSFSMFAIGYIKKRERIRTTSAVSTYENPGKIYDPKQANKLTVWHSEMNYPMRVFIFWLMRIIDGHRIMRRGSSNQGREILTQTKSNESSRNWSSWPKVTTPGLL